MNGAPRTRLLRGYGPLVAAALLFVLMATFVPTVGKQVETRTVAGPAGCTIVRKKTWLPSLLMVKFWDKPGGTEFI